MTSCSSRRREPQWTGRAWLGEVSEVKDQSSVSLFTHNSALLIDVPQRNPLSHLPLPHPLPRNDINYALGSCATVELIPPLNWQRTRRKTISRGSDGAPVKLWTILVLLTGTKKMSYELLVFSVNLWPENEEIEIFY